MTSDEKCSPGPTLGETGYMTSSLVQWGGFVAPASWDHLGSWDRIMWYAVFFWCFGKIWCLNCTICMMSMICFKLMHWYILYISYIIDIFLLLNPPKTQFFPAFQHLNTHFSNGTNDRTPATPASLCGSWTWDHHLCESQRSSGHRNTWRHPGLNPMSRWIGRGRGHIFSWKIPSFQVFFFGEKMWGLKEIFGLDMVWISTKDT